MSDWSINFADPLTRTPVYIHVRPGTGLALSTRLTDIETMFSEAVAAEISEALRREAKLASNAQQLDVATIPFTNLDYGSPATLAAVKAGAGVVNLRLAIVDDRSVEVNCPPAVAEQLAMALESKQLGVNMSTVEMIAFVDLDEKADAYAWLSTLKEGVGLVASIGDNAAETAYSAANGAALLAALRQAIEAANGLDAVQRFTGATIPTSDLEAQHFGTATITAAPGVVRVRLAYPYDDITIACSPSVGAEIAAALERKLAAV